MRIHLVIAQFFLFVALLAIAGCSDATQGTPSVNGGGIESKDSGGECGICRWDAAVAKSDLVVYLVILDQSYDEPRQSLLTKDLNCRITRSIFRLDHRQRFAVVVASPVPKPAIVIPHAEIASQKGDSPGIPSNGIEAQYHAAEELMNLNSVQGLVATDLATKTAVNLCQDQHVANVSLIVITDTDLDGFETITNRIIGNARMVTVSIHPCYVRVHELYRPDVVDAWKSFARKYNGRFTQFRWP